MHFLTVYVTVCDTVTIYQDKVLLVRVLCVGLILQTEQRAQTQFCPNVITSGHKSTEVYRTAWARPH